MHIQWKEKSEEEKNCFVQVIVQMLGIALLYLCVVCKKKNMFAIPVVRNLAFADFLLQWRLRGTEQKRNRKEAKSSSSSRGRKKKLLFLSFHLIPLSLYCVYCKWQMVDVLLGSTHIENLYPIVHVYDSIICATRVPNSTAPPTTTKFYMNKIPVEKDRIEIVYFAHTYSHWEREIHLLAQAYIVVEYVHNTDKHAHSFVLHDTHNRANIAALQTSSHI